MQLEKKEKIEMIEDGLSKIRRSLDDLKMLEQSDKTITDILKLLVSIKTIIGNDENLLKDNISSDYETQVLVIESEIESYLSLHNYQTISYSQGKKDFSEVEKYTCKQLIDTDKKELDHTVERTVSIGIALSDGEIVIPPEVNLYKYRGGKHKLSFPKFITSRLMIASVLFALVLSFAFFAIDRDNSFFAKVLFSLGVSIPLVLLVFVMSLSSFITKKRDSKAIVSDYVGFTALLTSVFLTPVLIMDFKIYKVVAMGAMFLLGFVYVIVRMIFYCSKKFTKKSCPLFEYLEKNKKYIFGFSLSIFAINLIPIIWSVFEYDGFNLYITIFFNAIYGLAMIWLILATKDKGKRVGLFAGYVLSLILVSVNLSWYLIGINFVCAVLTLFLTIGDKLCHKKN